ncbi:MAG: class I SAM-dependent methyltransferase [Bacteroidales bacterium]|nr:class I SAM-dependent methyltransferase [Bacteroidales bacterium]
MKNRYIAFTVLALIIITVTAQNMSIFTKATRSGWYPEFLYPVMEEITIMGEKKEILDIGTGPGTLPQLLIMKDSGLQVTGIDIDSAMINEAKRRFIHNHVKYQNQKINESLEFDSEQFDVVTFCSVLF